MFSLKFKTTCRLKPGSYFYFPGAEDPKDWYKVISIDRETDTFTMIWLYDEGKFVADPLRTTLSSYIDDIMCGGIIVSDPEDYIRVPEILRLYPYVQDQS